MGGVSSRSDGPGNIASNEKRAKSVGKFDEFVADLASEEITSGRSTQSVWRLPTKPQFPLVRGAAAP